MKNVNLGTIFERVAKWNEARYPRIYNHELSVNLLQEELTEYFEAKTSVDQLDALCDLVYVSMGILWKTSISIKMLDSDSARSNSQALALLTGHDFEPIHLVATVLTRHKYTDSKYSVSLAIQTVITFCMVQMALMGLDTAESLDALLVVCECNDSKSVEKVESHIKANGKDKGKNFVSPEYALSIILTSMEKRRNGDKRNN